MPTLSTHVLDAVTGAPAAGLTVALSRPATAQPGSWEVAAQAVTDTEGRVRDLAPGGLPAGSYRLTFATGEWFAAAGRAAFYPEVTVTFAVADERHHHVPLLLSPFAYSTYRGS